MEAKILVVDDEPEIREVLVRFLSAPGYVVMAAADGPEALALAAGNSFSLALVDISMPGMSGLELLAELKHLDPGISVVLMTAYPSPETKAAGLERGACSYLVKPFTKAEVLAAVELGLREAKAVQVGDLLLDPRARRVVCGDEEVCLTHLEFDLLAYLVRNAGRVVGYDELLREVWGYDYTAGGQETIKSCVKRLRRKIEPDPEQPRYLVTVRGVGYRWAIPPTLVLPQPPRG
ncbi:MAG: response regulator transcription factor [Anaerolineae bacterium]|nr:response regulator transcription factor [Anaerolineae bacterium]